MLVMGVPLGSIASVLLGLYAYVLPLALYAAWISIAMWDLIRRDLSDGRRIGWMALVLVVPLVGPIAYFAFGGSAISRNVRLFLVLGGMAIYLGVAALAVAVRGPLGSRHAGTWVLRCDLRDHHRLDRGEPRHPGHHHRRRDLGDPPETPRRGATRRRKSLRARLATGEIDQAEFLVRMRALHDGDDRDIT